MNEREYEALEDEYLSHEARSLYLLCFRRHMDFQTGLVGTEKRRISFQMFREQLTVSRPRGSTKAPFKPSPQQLRGYVGELERVGLVERTGCKKKLSHMVFLLPLATTDLNRPNEEQQRSNTQQQRYEQQGEQRKDQHEEQREEEHNKTQYSQGFKGNEQQAQQQEEQQGEQREEQQGAQQRSNVEEQHTSVTSDITSSHTNAPARENSEVIHTPEDFDRRFQSTSPTSVTTNRKFAMHNDWQLDYTFADQALKLGVNLSSLDEDQAEVVEFALIEFRTWWQETNPGFVTTQTCWQQKFIQTSLQHALKKLEQALNNKNTAGGTDYGQPAKRHHTGRQGHQGSPTTRPFTAEDFDLNAEF